MRHLAEADLPPGKTLDNFDFSVVPMLSKARVIALAAGDAWLDKASNLLCFGPSGAKVRAILRESQSVPEPLCRERLSCSISPSLPTIVPWLSLHGGPCNSGGDQPAHDRYDLLILDDLCYVHRVVLSSPCCSPS